jgi:hypothetical protein
MMVDVERAGQLGDERLVEEADAYGNGPGRLLSDSGKGPEAEEKQADDWQDLPHRDLPTACKCSPKSGSPHSSFPMKS